LVTIHKLKLLFTPQISLYEHAVILSSSLSEGKHIFIGKISETLSNHSPYLISSASALSSFPHSHFRVSFLVTALLSNAPAGSICLDYAQGDYVTRLTCVSRIARDDYINAYGGCLWTIWSSDADLAVGGSRHTAARIFPYLSQICTVKIHGRRLHVLLPLLQNQYVNPTSWHPGSCSANTWEDIQ
jgi:hypothetical protein